MSTLVSGLLPTKAYKKLDFATVAKFGAPAHEVPD